MRKLIAVIFPLLVSCEVMVDVDVPFEKQQVTVNSFFNPDSLWSVQLSLNRHVLDSKPFQEINDAQVILYEGLDPVDTLLNTGYGVFRSDNKKPEKERTYSVRVSVPGYDELFATSSTPLPATISRVEIFESSNTMIRIRIQDNASEKNFYQLYAIVENDYYDNNSKQIVKRSGKTNLTSEHPAIRNESNSPSTAVLFTDALFNGNEVEFTFATSGGGSSFHSGIDVIVRSLSEDAYNYLKTSHLNDENSGDPFAQPINVYNNIENGFGIFAGYSASMYSGGAQVPVITSIDPPSGKAGDHVVITGANFLSSPGAQPSVSFQTQVYPMPGQLVEATDSRIEVIVPEEAITGKILVRGGRLALSDTEFVVGE